MFNGINGDHNGGGSSSKRLFESAAESVFLRGLTRMITIAVTGLGFPALVAFGIWGLTAYSKTEESRDLVNKTQTEALQQVSNTLVLIEYRLSQAEKKNGEQDQHFMHTDRRVNRLERVIPVNPRSGWPYDPEGDFGGPQ
jgi:hypothetical protein